MTKETAMIKTRNSPVRVEAEPRTFRPGATPRTLRPAQPVDHGAVRARAYELYVERSRNGESGDELSDWVRAERELNGANPERGESLLRDPE
jgi:hypothetical protein